MGQKVGKEDKAAAFAVVKSKVPLTEDQLDDLWKLYAKHCDKEGRLSKAAMKKMLTTDAAMMQFGSLATTKNADDETFDSLFRAFDVDQSGFVDFVELSILLHAYSSKDTVERLKMFFRMFDIHNKRELGLDDIAEAKSALFRKVDPEALFKAVDKSNTGKITEEAWVENLKDNLQMRASFDYQAEDEYEKYLEEQSSPADCVIVRTMTGKKYIICGLTEQSTGAEIKTKINDETGIPTDQQRLFTVKGTIEDEDTLAGKGLGLRCRITLMLRLRGN